jgi:hypothetical protein
MAVEISNRPPRVVVAGDVCIDWLAMPTRGHAGADAKAPPANWRLRDGLEMSAQPGGAWLLANFIRAETGRPVIQQTVPRGLENQPFTEFLHSIVELGGFPATASEKDKQNPANFVWRVSRYRGFAGRDHLPVPAIKNDDKTADIVVLDDVGNGFRHAKDRWPAALSAQGRDQVIVWKLSRPLLKGALADHILSQHAGRTIVVLDVDDLRAEGAAILRQLSWESTTADVIRTVSHDPAFAGFRRVAQLVVRLNLEGAVHFSHFGTKDALVSVTYLPEGIEGSTRSETPGEMLGLNSAFVAVLVRELARSGASASSLAARVATGVRAGLVTSRRILRAGLGSFSGQPVALLSLVGQGTEPTTGIVTVSLGPVPSQTSRLFDYVTTGPQERLAERILERGIRSVIAEAPIARFGALETVDRWEIEAYRSVRNLIAEYLAQPNPERPLSMAVFGPPGSGKSFGVLQVAKSLRDVEKIEFNVSQFEGPRQLTAAFHAVRDAVVRGRVPLVFFDEFDADHNGPLGWLKHFLAPMQDGKFTDGESTHLIGRVILVFAGGTRATFEAFARLDDEQFVKAKGPDFVSRLRGVMNVRGTDRTPTDAMSIIRRAVLLRSILMRKAPTLADEEGTVRIDPGLRRAFLGCRRFKHGVRSMEAIIDMSLLTGRTAFERSSLPSESQLDLHVEGEAFMELSRQDLQLGAQREALARAIHERFVRDQTGRKPARDPNMRPWAKLSEHTREANRAQADDYPRKLAFIGCGYEVARGSKRPPLVRFTPDEIEGLAEDEHNRWMASKRAAKWTYAPGKRNDRARTHPSLVPWSDLSEVEKDKDRKTVAAIPELLASVGLRVRRLE